MAKTQTVRAGVDAVPFVLALHCPQCGAPFEVAERAVSHRCSYCTSLLIIDVPARGEVLVESPRLNAEAAYALVIEARIRDAVRHLDYDPNSAGGALLFSTEEDEDLSDLTLRHRRNQIAKKVTSAHRLLSSDPFWVPYEQTVGKVVQLVLGRRGDDLKLVICRAFAAETTAPWYDTTVFNLRDRGLRSAWCAMRPVDQGDLASPRRFVPVSDAPMPNQLLRRWLGDSLDPAIEKISLQSKIVPSARFLVYRPFFLLRLKREAVEEGVLVDAAMGTIAGSLGPEEVKKLLGIRKSAPKALDLGSTRQVRVIGSRCPNCSAEQKIPTYAVVSFCPNCHAGMEVTPRGLKTRNYLREEGLRASRKVTLLPFWTFSFEVKVDGEKHTTLESWARATFPQTPPADFTPAGNRVYVPATALLTTEAGDRCFARLAHLAHHANWDLTPDRVDLNRRPQFLPVTVPCVEAQDLTRAALFSSHTKLSASKLNTLLLKKTIFDAEIRLADPQLVLVALTERSDAVERDGVTVPKLLLAQSPILLAQRMTVERAAAERMEKERRKPSPLDKIRQAGGPDNRRPLLRATWLR